MRRGDRTGRGDRRESCRSEDCSPPPARPRAAHRVEGFGSSRGVRVGDTPLDGDLPPFGRERAAHRLNGTLHGARARPAVALVVGKGSIDESHDCRGEARVDRCERWRVDAHRETELLVGRLGRVHQPTRQHGEQRGSHGPHVTALVHLADAPARLLRWRKRRCPEQRSVDGREAAAARLDDPRDTEVEHLEIADGGDEQIFRLDIAVQDPLRVGRREHVQQTLGHVQGVCDG